MSSTLLINPSALEAGLQARLAARVGQGAIQQAAFERFAKSGFPNRRREGWRWSDFRAALNGHADIADCSGGGEQVDIAPSAFAALNPLEFRIINGRITLPDEAKPEGVGYRIIEPLATIPELEAHPIASLNVAMAPEALGMEVCAGVSLARPILIRHINTAPGFTFGQTALRISEKARALIIETYENAGDENGAGATGFYSHLGHMWLRDGAEVERIVLQNNAAQSVNHGICATKIDAAARFEQASLATGSRLSRFETILHFWGEGASADVNSAALLSGARHCDMTSQVVFKEQNCKTRQLHKGVARDRGRNVFQGKFEVERKAQRTDAKMTANAMLLSDTAEANHKPELEIYADDVECAHGSTAGALDEDALFYLRQRGLDEHAARALLIEAFLGEVVDKIEDECVRNIFRAHAGEWLEGAA